LETGKCHRWLQPFIGWDVSYDFELVPGVAGKSTIDDIPDLLQAVETIHRYNHDPGAFSWEQSYDRDSDHKLDAAKLDAHQNSAKYKDRIRRIERKLKKR